MSEPAGKKMKLEEASPLVELFESERAAAAKNILDFRFDRSRIRIINDQEKIKEHSKGVIYWMFRDQRVQDNWAFLFAQKLGFKSQLPLHVCFCLLPKYLDANMRHYRFLVKGLQEIEEECKALNISFHLFFGNGGEEVPKFVAQHNIGAIVCDFCPLRLPKQWLENLKQQTPENVPIIQVDAHNIVPVWVASDKQEYAARTIRNKINGKLDKYLTQFPPVVRHPIDCQLKKVPKNDWKNCWKHTDIEELEDIDGITPGYKGAVQQLELFCTEKLKNYASKRNDPLQDAQSDLSPWFHFGQIAPQRCVLEVKKLLKKHKEGVEAFMEEAIVRRELSDNFCFYNEQYDSLEGCASWAQKTLNDHRKDKRTYLYSLDELEKAKSHDDLWNAAQIQLVKQGKMHGFLRMYWAKKILEWTDTPENALTAAIHLNDKYSMDGRDPNGYVGMALTYKSTNNSTYTDGIFNQDACGPLEASTTKDGLSGKYSAKFDT